MPYHFVQYIGKRTPNFVYKYAKFYDLCNIEISISQNLAENQGMINLTELISWDEKLSVHLKFDPKIFRIVGVMWFYYRNYEKIVIPIIPNIFS